MKFDWVATEGYVVVIEVTLAVRSPGRLTRKPLAATETEHGEACMLPMVVSVAVIHMLPWIAPNTMVTVSACMLVLNFAQGGPLTSPCPGGR